MNVNCEDNWGLCEPDCTPSSIAVWDIPECSGSPSGGVSLITLSKGSDSADRAGMGRVGWSSFHVSASTDDSYFSDGLTVPSTLPEYPGCPPKAVTSSRYPLSWLQFAEWASWQGTRQAHGQLLLSG
ncbi:unnamed protein product [Fraxinus pennsylvanica]|uniref:Uncharacterized protein n=1 Tax=Fraxinus pennsylvanica TaxID=56036 RepID=A0AAD2ALT5_9LAMI|nr:unnamed protein product [Fraxinus pennsylvanica]